MSDQLSQTQTGAGIYDYSMPDSPRSNRRKSKRKRSIANFRLHDKRLTRGLLLVSLGVLFLGAELGIWTDLRWWALFLIVPGLVKLSAIWADSAQRGESIGIASKGACRSLFLVGLGLIFLFNLDFGVIWPLFFILPGIWMLRHRQAKICC
jgi:hypothetical protein